MPTYFERVLKAPSPQHALQAIAEGIDVILNELEVIQSAQVRQPDSWLSAWEAPAVPTPEPYSTEAFAKGLTFPSNNMESKPKRDERQIAALREALSTCTDEEDRRALEAQLRLADEGGFIPAAQYSAEGTGDGVTRDEAALTVLVESPPPDPERFAARYDWATRVELGSQFQPPMDVTQAAESYAKGGPLWLYHGNDELVRGFPSAWKVLLIQDIEQDSPRTAQEVARDILKADADAAREATTAIKGGHDGWGAE